MLTYTDTKTNTNTNEERTGRIFYNFYRSLVIYFSIFENVFDVRCSILSNNYISVLQKRSLMKEYRIGIRVNVRQRKRLENFMFGQTSGIVRLCIDEHFENTDLMGELENIKQGYRDGEYGPKEFLREYEETRRRVFNRHNQSGSDVQTMLAFEATGIVDEIKARLDQGLLDYMESLDKS